MIIGSGANCTMPGVIHPGMRAVAREWEGYSLQNDALILGGPPHEVVCIVSKLEYVWCPYNA